MVGAGAATGTMTGFVNSTVPTAGTTELIVVIGIGGGA
jgi:hypothetical protein